MRIIHRLPGFGFGFGFGSTPRQPSPMRSPRPYPFGLALLRIPRTLFSASSVVRLIRRLSLPRRPSVGACSFVIRCCC
jgi:hypothetical protein